MARSRDAMRNAYSLQCCWCLQLLVVVFGLRGEEVIGADWMVLVCVVHAFYLAYSHTVYYITNKKLDTILCSVYVFVANCIEI
mmetsp:Transcript_15111/g.28454  ORF Transcript_15111/g.28454 Transcript_15111/m.28454 type:complete len:83 (+) Transcript_15111:424-672(+)